jgi:APA family basic amino acid/polyamine antiporter
LKLVNPIVAILAAVGCVILMGHLGRLVLQVYCVTLPVGLLIYFTYSRHHSNLAKAEAAAAKPEDLIPSA